MHSFPVDNLADERGCNQAATATATVNEDGADRCGHATDLFVAAFDTERLEAVRELHHQRIHLTIRNALVA